MSAEVRHFSKRDDAIAVATSLLHSGATTSITLAEHSTGDWILIWQTHHTHKGE